MLTALEIFGPHTSPPTLPLGGGGAEADPIQVKNIDGLGPVKSDISTSLFADSIGSYFTGGSVGPRNIVITVGLNPNWDDQTFDSLRQLLYAYFMPNQIVKLRFSSTTRPVVTVDGYVESVEPNIFSQDPEVQVSIICPQPDFVSVESTQVAGAIETMGDFITVDYIGNVPTGFEVVVHATPALTDYSGVLVMTNTNPTPKSILSEVKIDTAKYFHISSIHGSKFIRQVYFADGVIENLLGSTYLTDGWLELTPGINQFVVSATTPGQEWTLTYHARYGGL